MSEPSKEVIIDEISEGVFGHPDPRVVVRDGLDRYTADLRRELEQCRAQCAVMAVAIKREVSTCFECRGTGHIFIPGSNARSSCPACGRLNENLPQPKGEVR